ncbi:MAG: PD-(D/E)XK nuclease family protein [Synergistaceae bacterium]|nr:PD-(D/E)XK nuclease family protein [Synergistaceae bacterium]
MSIYIHAYNNASELRSILQSIKGENIKYVIPSRKDKFFFPLRDSYRELWTWQDIYDDISKSEGSSKKHSFSPPDHFLILDSILDGVLEKFRKLDTYREKIASLPGIGRAGFLEVLSSDIRELLNEAVSPDQLVHVPDSDSPAEFLLPEVYSRYTDYLSRSSLIDSAQLCTSAAESLAKNPDWGKDFTIVFTGFLSFNHSQLELVKALESRCTQVIIIKPEANLEGFGDASSQFGKNIHAPHSSGHIAEMDITEPGLEPELIARTLALWSAREIQDWGEFPGFDAIGLMIQQGKEDSFAQAFGRYGVPYDFMSGIPISQTLPGKILASLQNLSARNFPAYETALLLTQPCFAGVHFPVMSAFRAGRTGLDDWEDYLAGSEGEIFSEALKAIRAIRKFCNILQVKNTPLKLMQAFRDFLTAPDLWLEREDKTADLPELDEAARLTASAIETIQHKVLTLEELLPDLGAVNDERLEKDKAYEFLLRWCRNTNTRAPVQVSNAVRVFTGQPPVLASFPVWIMAGVTQRSYSGNLPMSPLLGSEDRKRLGELDVPLLSQAEKARQREAVFRRLIHTGEAITIISRPMLDDEGRPAAESPFMQNFSEDMADTWRIEKVHDEPEGINILLGGDKFTFPDVDPQDRTERTRPLITKKAHIVGASDIHELLLCPFLWWQKRQAKIFEQDSELASSAEWGNLLHKYWECVWKAYSLDMTAPGQVFTRIAKNECEKLTGKETPEEYEKFHRLLADPRLRRKLESIAWRVERLAKVQGGILDGLHDGGYVHREILLEENAHLMTHLDGVTFLGQCDRIEILTAPDGSRVAFIADYKTGAGESNEAAVKIGSYWWDSDKLGKFTKGLQLSVYAALFDSSEKLSGVDLSDIDLAGVYILGLEGGKISGTFTSPAKDIFEPYKSGKFGGAIQTRIDEGNYAMACAVKVLDKGEFCPEYGSDLCRYCHVKSMCRRGEFRAEVLDDESGDSDND